MKKKNVMGLFMLIVTMAFLVACGQVADQAPITSGRYDMDRFELAPELAINQEIATMLPYEVSISLNEALVSIETFYEKTAVMYTKQSTIEYFDGTNWVVIVQLKDLFPYFFSC